MRKIEKEEVRTLEFSFRLVQVLLYYFTLFSAKKKLNMTWFNYTEKIQTEIN